MTRLFEEDRELVQDLSESDALKLQRHVSVPLEIVRAGRWTPPRAEAGREPGLLILEGHLTREVEIFGRGAIELVGPGDLLVPSEASHSPSIPAVIRWKALTDSRLALLNVEFQRTISGWPQVQLALQGRGVRRGRLTAVQLALARIPRVAVRLHLLFWHLADRWGEQEGDAIVVRLPLPHWLLGGLVSARREAASHAVSDLSRRHLVTRRSDHFWRVHPPPPRQVEQLDALVAEL